MNSSRPYDTPTEATAEDGHVFIEGPEGLAATFTAGAAAESGKRISKAATKAAKQKPATPPPLSPDDSED